jgi:hypothetical protein
MSNDEKLKSSELVLRALVRLPVDLGVRPFMDDNDFVRRKNYKNTGRPENGISLFRKDKFATTQAVWDRLRMSNQVGLAECAFGKIESKGLKYIIDGENAEHVSLRCPACDMKNEPGAICKPDDFSKCPFFDIDTFDLEAEFEVTEPPA